METLQYCIRKVLYGVPLIIGVTFFSFLFMVYFGPDQTYELVGKNATQEQINEIRHQLGYDQPFFVRYKNYLVEIATLNFGHSNSSGEQVIEILKKRTPISLAVEIPGFLLGNILAIAIALVAAYFRGRWQDRLIMVLSVIGMSISALVIIMSFQIIFCSTYGLDLFPVQGWDVEGWSSYLKFVTVPTLTTVFVALGFNTRFYRAVLVEEMGRDHVRTARAYGTPAYQLMWKNVFFNSLIPVITRIILSIPYVLIGGSLLVETYFSIPGIGLATYEAITSGDQPVLKAMVAVTAIIYVVVLTSTDILYRLVDPRVSLK